MSPSGLRQTVESEARAAFDASSDRVAARVLTVIGDTMRSVEDCSAASPDLSRRACRAGCSSCCYLAVSITAPEALYIASILRETRSETDLNRAIAKIGETSKRVSHLTIEARAQVRIPCALLGDAGECTIHAFRPIGCRGWTSFSKEDCDTALRDAQPGHSGPMDRDLWQAAGAATEGLEHAARNAGLDAGQYEFHAALLCAFGVDATTWFLAGASVFAGCPRVTSELLRSLAPPRSGPGNNSFKSIAPITDV